MALWHFLKDEVGYSWQENGQDVSSFDDGLSFIPGEDGFSSDAADAKAATLGDDVTAQYTGCPNWQIRVDADAAAAAEAAQEAQQQVELEAAQASATAELEAVLNPQTPQQIQTATINAKYDAMLALLPDRADDIQKARDAELAGIAE